MFEAHVNQSQFIALVAYPPFCHDTQFLGIMAQKQPLAPELQPGIAEGGKGESMSAHHRYKLRQIKKKLEHEMKNIPLPKP